jgi:hypothetical protein
MATLEKLAREKMELLLMTFPRDFWQRLSAPMTWSEEISGEEMQFEVQVLKSDASTLNVFVTIQDPKGITFSTNVFLDE